MKYALIYGGIAGTIVIAVITASIALDLPSHAQSEWFGYLVMFAALSLIFVGVKRYRDIERGGVIGFGRAFGIGLGIAAVATLFYVVGWEVYVRASGFDLMTDYAAGMIETMRREGASAAAIEAQTAEMQRMAVRYRDPLFRMPITAVEILPVGILVALISAAILRNPRVLPARA